MTGAHDESARPAITRGFIEGPPRAAQARARSAATSTAPTYCSTSVLCRSVADLSHAADRHDPWALTLMPAFLGSARTFGRDGLITAMQLLWADPAIARGVLHRLALHSGDRDDPEARCRARQDPARDARRRDGARSAKCPSRAITAASIPRRCSSCCSADISSAPATSKPSPSSGPTSRRRCAGSTAPAIRTATASSNISAHTADGLEQSGLEGFARCPSSTPTAVWPRGRSRCARCRPMSMPPSSAPRAWRRLLGARPARRAAARCRPRELRGALRGSVLVRRAWHLRAGAGRR